MKQASIAFVLIVALLTGCGEDRSQYHGVPQQQPQVVYVPTPAPAPEQQQQVPQPQAAQTNSGPGWGAVAAGVIGGAILGHVLTDKKPQVRDVIVQDNRYNYDSRRYTPAPRPAAPKPVVPVTPPKPNLAPQVFSTPKPTVAPAKPSFAPTSSYTQRQNTPTYSAPPTRSYSMPTTTYRSSTTRR